MNRSNIALALVLLVIVCAGCGRLWPGKGPSSGTGPTQQTGPPLAIVVIDSTHSVMSKWPLIRNAVSQFIAAAAREREFDLAVVRLDSMPQDPKEIYEGSRFTEEQWEELQTYITAEGQKGEGTDQVAGMKKVLQLAAGSGNTVPQSVVVLYFSDMLVDSPTDGSASFDQWDTFDWDLVKRAANIREIQFYCIRPADPKGDSVQRQAYKRQEELLPKLMEATRTAKLGNVLWIRESVLADQVNKERFRGPEF